MLFKAIPSAPDNILYINRLNRVNEHDFKNKFIENILLSRTKNEMIKLTEMIPTLQ